MSAEAKLSRLSMDLKKSQTPPGSSANLKGLQTEPPESWDDGYEEDESPVEAPGPSLRQVTSNDGPAPPPPTPISPSRKSTISSVGQAEPRTGAINRQASDRRPEKTVGAANRMIAGALGLKAPKKSEEQRQYDRAVKEAEIKRRNKEKQAQEQEKLNDEQAKAAIWDS